MMLSIETATWLDSEWVINTHTLIGYMVLNAEDLHDILWEFQGITQWRLVVVVVVQSKFASLVKVHVQ